MPGLEQARDLLQPLDEAIQTLLLVGMLARELSCWVMCPTALGAGTTVATGATMMGTGAPQHTGGGCGGEVLGRAERRTDKSGNIPRV